MLRRLQQIIPAIFLLVLFNQCAQVGELTGGKRDTQPPKLLQALPAQNSTGFNTDVIAMKFDEFVQVKDLSNQLIVSPKLKTTPDISANGKTIRVELKKEELKPNTTYRIYFGNAIADMNESNSIQKFEYVFSTGSFIDSLEVNGTVTDAFNNKPVGNVVVGLYKAEAVSDSTLYKETPDYLAISSDKGEYTFKNLPYADFKMFALTDGNKNTIYDSESEKIGFRDSVLSLRSDTSVQVKIFQEESVKGFIKKSLMPYYGLAQVLLNKKARVEIRPLKAELAANISETRAGQEKDTVSFYYKDLKDTLEMLVDNITFRKKDTLRLVIPKNNSAKKRLKPVKTNLGSGVLSLGSKLKLSFLNWMDTTRVDLSKAKLEVKKDSLLQPVPLNGRWTSVTDYELSELAQGSEYRLKIDSLAFFDINGFTNDSLRADFKTQSRLEFGKATLKVLLNKKQSYLIQLVGAGDMVAQQQSISFSLSSSNAASLVFTDVPPGTYSVKIIFDDNGNKKWDSGNLLAKKQAERVIIHSKQIKVLSDWEIEEEITVKE